MCGHSVRVEQGSESSRAERSACPTTGVWLGLPFTHKWAGLHPGVGWVERPHEPSAGSLSGAQPIVHLLPHPKMGYGAPDHREQPATRVPRLHPSYTRVHRYLWVKGRARSLSCYRGRPIRARISSIGKWSLSTATSDFLVPTLRGGMHTLRQWWMRPSGLSTLRVFIGICG